MKNIKNRLISLGLFLLMMQSVTSQIKDNSINPSNKEMAGLYLQKQKTNNTMGFVMLGAGIAMIAGGLAINVNTGWGEGNKNNWNL